MTRKEKIIEILGKGLRVQTEFNPRFDNEYSCIEGINDVADEILAIPIDVPGEEEISYALDTFNFSTSQEREIAYDMIEWAINRIKELNK